LAFQQGFEAYSIVIDFEFAAIIIVATVIS